MNKIEKIIYNTVKKNVALKRVLRKIYQSIFLIIPAKKYQCKYAFFYKEGYFFGFHDKTPWNNDGQKILAHKYKEISTLPNQNDEIEVGYFTDNTLSHFHCIDRTLSWNWQQGSMLQWIGQSNKIVFNTWIENQNKAKIIDLDTSSFYFLPQAINAVSLDGKYAIGIDYERLNIGMFGYGYANSAKLENILEEIPKNLGFNLLDIKTGKTKIFKSIYQINQQLKEQKIINAYLFVTHFIFSNDNSRFLFLLRGYQKGKRLISRLITCQVETGEMYLLPTGNMVSHITWVNSNKILAYCSDKNEKDGYYLFDDLSQNSLLIGEKNYNFDGHPQFNSFKNSFVSDSYPNRRRLQELSIFNLTSNKKDIIAKFYSPMKYIEEFRCDLHPRWDRNGKFISVDTTFSGKRSLAIINLEKQND